MVAAVSHKLFGSESFSFQFGVASSIGLPGIHTPRFSVMVRTKVFQLVVAIAHPPLHHDRRESGACRTWPERGGVWLVEHRRCVASDVVRHRAI